MNLKFITHNWHIKVIALLIAIGTWIYAASAVTTVAKFPSGIPIKVINLNPGMVAIYDQKEADIQIAAEPAVWQNLTTESFTAFIDLGGRSPGTYTVPLNVTTTVSDLQIISKTPSSLVVSIEPGVEKGVPVVAKISGNAAENMTAGDITFNPEKVKISGPNSVVSGISQVVAPIVLSGESENFSKSVKILAEDNEGHAVNFVSYLPQQVSADVKIVKAGNVKNLGVKVVTSGVPASGFYVSSVSTNPAILGVIGSADILRALSSISTQSVDISNLNKNLSIKVFIDIPSGVKIDGNISSVTVTINLSSTPITRTLTIPVKTQNLPSGLKIVSISPQTIDTVVAGPSDVINGLSSDNISLEIDLLSANSGSNIVNITNNNFSLPAGVSISGFQPQNVNIILSSS